MQMEVEEAWRLLEALPVKTAAETLPLSASLGRILDGDIRAGLAVPPFEKSPFDGYACRAADTPGRLRITGLAAAGCGALPTLGRGEAIRIFTGAPLPAGADTVFKQEDVTAEGGTLLIPFPAAVGQNVICRGEDIREGALLVKGGTRLEPGHLGLLASQGIERLTVFCRPRALLLPTGTELFEPGQTRSAYGIYNSSSFTLAAYLARMGLQVQREAIVPDEASAVQSAVRTALESDVQVVFTTGGASVGDYDFAVRTAEALGAEPLFGKLRMKPGGTLLVSRWQDKLLVNLSGNPAAAVMSLLVVLRPWLERLCGEEAGEEFLTLPVWAPMPKRSPVLRLLRGHLRLDEGRAWFYEHQGRGNGNLASFVGCDLIGFVPGESMPLERGNEIRALRLPPYLRGGV